MNKAISVLLLAGAVCAATADGMNNTYPSNYLLTGCSTNDPINLMVGDDGFGTVLTSTGMSKSYGIETVTVAPFNAREIEVNILSSGTPRFQASRNVEMYNFRRSRWQLVATQPVYRIAVEATVRVQGADFIHPEKRVVLTRYTWDSREIHSIWIDCICTDFK
jgi:hypothetical protein